MKNYFAFFLLLCLGGCATYNLSPKEIPKGSLSNVSGLLIGSFARDPRGKKYFDQSFYFRNINTGKKHSISAQPTFNMYSGKTPDDYSYLDSAGGVFVIALEAGEYEFYNFNLYQSNGAFSQYFSAPDDYSISFIVEPNKLNYVGEIKVTTITSKGMFGVPGYGGGFWVISNQVNRDLEIVESKYPELEGKVLVDSIPKKEELIAPLVYLPSEVVSE